MMDITSRSFNRRRFLLAAGAVGGGVLLSGKHPARAAAGTGSAEAADVVLFDDPCDSLGASGWTVSPAAGPGAYIIDSTDSTSNPLDVEFLPVPDGQYLMYGSPLSLIGYDYDLLSREFAIGPGAWRLDVNARIVDLIAPYRNIYANGVSFRITAADVVTGSQLYEVNFVDHDDVLLVMPGSWAQITAVTMPDPQEFHRWSISFDGISTVRVELDGSDVAVWSGSGITQSGAEGIQILNLPTDGQDGQTEVYFDRLTFTKTAQTVLMDRCDAIAPSWSADPPGVAAYITDHDHTAGTVSGIKDVPAGSYLAYATGGSSASLRMSPAFAEPTTTWQLEFRARMASLPSSAGGGGGFGWNVVAGGLEHSIAWTSPMTLTVVGDDGAAQSFGIAVPQDTAYHGWRLGYDETGRLHISLDGQRVGLAATSGVPSSATDELALFADAGSAGGSVEVYIDAIKAVRDVRPLWFQPAFSGVSVLPDASAQEMNVVVLLDDVDPQWISEGSLTLSWALHRDGARVGAGSVVVDATLTTLRLTTGQSGIHTIDLRLVRGATTLASTTHDVRVPASVVAAEPGQTVIARAGVDYLIGDLADRAGGSWLKSRYSYDGTAVSGDFVETQPGSAPFTIGVPADGAFAVYLGFVTGSEEFVVTVGDETASVPVTSGVSGTAYGSLAIGEVLAYAGSLSGRQIQVAPMPGKASRLAYVRLHSLDRDEVAIAFKRDEGARGKRVIYNNDGTSQMSSKQVTDVASLKQKAVDIYAGADAGALAYCVGTTFLLLYNSAFAGPPARTYQGLTDAQRARMTAGDVALMNFVLNTVTDTQSPLTIVAAEGRNVGIEVLASLRMNEFYPQASYPWLNGYLYPEYYAKYAKANYVGSENFYLSYNYEEVRTYIVHVLQEMAALPDVSGIELDFSRYPRVLGWEQVFIDAYRQKYGVDPRQDTSKAGQARVLADRAAIITDLLRDIRAKAPGKTVAVRIPQTVYYELGYDVATWVEEGLVDILTPTVYAFENFWTVTDELPALVKGTGTRLYGGIEYTLSGGDFTKAEEELIQRGIGSNIVRSYVSQQQYQVRAHEFYQVGYDGVYVFNNPHGTGALGLLGDKVKVEKWHTLAYPAEWVQNLVTATSGPVEVFSDDASNLAAAGWAVTAPAPGRYITDSADSVGNPDGVSLKAVPAGQYLLYADGSGALGAGWMTKYLSIGAGGWSVELTAKIVGLLTPSQPTLFTGVTVDVVAGNRLYALTLMDGDKALFRQDKAGHYVQDELAMPADGGFHVWQLAYDGAGVVSLSLDGDVVAQHVGIGFDNVAADRVQIYNSDAVYGVGTTEVYVDAISVRRIAAGG